MSAIKLKLDKTSFGSEAFFSGTVEAVKSTGYKFSGTLKVSAPFNRKNVDFSNTVRIGHGGVSGKYEHLDLDLGKDPVSDKTLKVEGQGERAANEKVEFYIAVNEGTSNTFKESPEVTCDLGVVADESPSGTENTLVDSQKALISEIKQQLPPEDLEKHAEAIKVYEKSLSARFLNERNTDE